MLKKIFISKTNVCGIEKEIIRRNNKPSYYIYYIYSKTSSNAKYNIIDEPIYGGNEEYDPYNPSYGEEYDPYNPNMDWYMFKIKLEFLKKIEKK